MRCVTPYVTCNIAARSAPPCRGCNSRQGSAVVHSRVLTPRAQGGPTGHRPGMEGQMNALLQDVRKVFFAGFLIAAACAARSEDLDRPLLLVAQPDLEGLYSRTALLVVPAAGGQHVGFIINRATDVKLATLFPEHAPSAKVVDPVYFGGPEMLGSIFAIVRRDPGVPALRLLEDLFVTGNGAAVDQHHRANAERRALLHRFRRLAGRRARQGARGRLLVRDRSRPGARLQRQDRRDVGRAGEARGQARSPAGHELDLV